MIADKVSLSHEALDPHAITEFEESLTTSTDPKIGYATKPFLYIRLIGRGNYGNNYSASIDRGMEAEK